MTIAKKDNDSFVSAIRSMTEKFIVLFETNSITKEFSWFEFRDKTLLSAIEHSFGVLTPDEHESYNLIFNQVMSHHGYVQTKVNQLDDKIEIWHNTPSLNSEIHEYLGIPWGDYSYFLFGQDVYLKS